MTFKTQFFIPTLLITLVYISLANAALPQRVNDQTVTSLASLVEEVSPAVVNIRVSQTVARRNSFDNEAFRRFFARNC